VFSPGAGELMTPWQAETLLYDPGQSSNRRVLLHSSDRQTAYPRLRNWFLEYALMDKSNRLSVVSTVKVRQLSGIWHEDRYRQTVVTW
jgi:hypothetical protein